MADQLGDGGWPLVGNNDSCLGSGLEHLLKYGNQLKLSGPGGVPYDEGDDCGARFPCRRGRRSEEECSEVLVGVPSGAEVEEEVALAPPKVLPLGGGLVDSRQLGSNPSSFAGGRVPAAGGEVEVGVGRLGVEPGVDPARANLDVDVEEVGGFGWGLPDKPELGEDQLDRLLPVGNLHVRGDREDDQVVKVLLVQNKSRRLDLGVQKVSKVEIGQGAGVVGSHGQSLDLLEDRARLLVPEVEVCMNGVHETSLCD